MATAAAREERGARASAGGGWKPVMWSLALWHMGSGGGVDARAGAGLGHRMGGRGKVRVVLRWGAEQRREHRRRREWRHDARLVCFLDLGAVDWI
jgi:hypothetical protein